MIDLKFGISESNFVDLRMKQYCFVDKTLFIKAIVNDDPRVSLYARPRRFGKTLLMTMLKEFLSFSGADVFHGLKISEDMEFCKKHQNQYPVIFLSLKDCKYAKFEKMIASMQTAISNLYLQHSYLLDSPYLLDYQKELFQRVLKKNTRDDVELADTLANLMTYLQQHTGKKVIVLLDEYDTPVHSSYMGGCESLVMEFMRSLMGQAFKDNPSLERGVITGISRVAQESLFSGLNNLKVYTVMDERHDSAFGFTEVEVRGLLSPEQIGLMDDIKDWYNGYSFGQAQIYNPWSIINCLFSHGKIECYWRNTADNSLIFKLISQGSKGLRANILQLMDGESISQNIDVNLDLKYLEQDPSAVWTLLVHAGYVTAQSPHHAGQAATLRIPNKEIRTIFDSMIEGWFKGTSKGVNAYEEFSTSLVQ